MGSMAVMSKSSSSVPVSMIQCTAPLLRLTLTMGYLPSLIMRLMEAADVSSDRST